MSKTFTVVGTSEKQGQNRLRLANGTAAARARVLEKAGHVDVLLFNLPRAMTADAAAEWLAAQRRAPAAESTARTPSGKHKVTEISPQRRQLDTVTSHDDRAKQLHQLSWQYDTAWSDLTAAARQTFRRYAAEDAAAGVTV